MRIDHPTAADIPALRQLWKHVFGDSDVFLDRFFSLAYSPERCLGAWENSTLAGALYWLPCTRGTDRFGYIYAVATHPNLRGKGICRSLMAAAHTRLTGQGFSGVLLYPQEEGLRAMYRKMGYETATCLEEGICCPSDVPAVLTEITPEAYFRLRGTYLPENSIHQEEPFVSLLAEDFRFYQGPGYLLTARLEKDHLNCTEFLGNKANLPGITRAFGAPFTRFRAPEGTTPFAMFCPLTPLTPPPSYFNFPLD